MDYFEAKFDIEPIVNTNNTKKWVLNEPYTAEKKQLKNPFTFKEYKINTNDYLLFKYIDNEFICANQKCKSRQVECIWYYYQAIDLRVDETFGEFYCQKCKKYTFVEHYRDDN